MKTKKSRINIPMALACILLCCVMISTHFVSGLYARYSSEAKITSSARVARFDVDVTTNGSETFEFSPEIKIRPTIGENDYSEIAVVNVKNTNEVAVSVKITVENKTGNIPFTFKINNDDLNADGNVFTKEYEVYPNNTDDQEYIIGSDWDSEDSLDYMGMVDRINIKVEVVQIN